jgi:ubiquinone/menaquinone biosynthesis C-methylase UbiE
MLVGNRIEHAKARGLEAIYLLTVAAQTYFERFGFVSIDRDEAPLEIRRTVEFSEACPKTAAVMKLGLRNDTHAHQEGNDMDIKKKVRDRYADAARRVRGQSEKAEGPNARSCCGGDETGAEKAITANLYDDAQLKDVPLEAALASLGCGNPTALAELKAGEVVLDLGSGGGIDVILTAKRVGPTGKAYGLDMTDEMLDVARENQRKAGLENVEFLKGEIEAIPLPAGSVDVVISNCVVNLSPDKPRVLREAFRVLKPGGRFAVSDIVSRGPIPEDIRRDMELWTGCIAGALEEKQYRTYLEDAGFERIDIEPTRVFRLEQGCCSGKKIQIEESRSETPTAGTFMSAFIRAVKPREEK